MASSPRRQLALLTVLSLLTTPPALGQRAAETPVGDQEWVRSEKNDNGVPTSLQTAIGRYQGRSGRGTVTVDLVGAIHVGDRAYYEELNRRFRGYDTVLYELVAPKGTAPRRGTRVGNDSPLGAMYNGFRYVLGLEHQLEVVDYTRPNFVHADMSLEQLLASMQKRDESVMKLYMRLIGQTIAEQTRALTEGESIELDLALSLVTSSQKQPANFKELQRILRVAAASLMDQLEEVFTSFGGENGTALIHDRNRVALDVLAREIAAGKKRIAIFYGAGHLADMDERLRQRFGLRQTDKEWVTAWDLSE